jgi:beta-lactam-binding protein with PASTA domain
VTETEKGNRSWFALTFAGALGFLIGVLLVIGLGAAHTRTTTVVRTIDPRTAVPPVVGERLDVARKALEDRGFDVKVEGGGLFGVVFASDWQVVGVVPPAGTRIPPGAQVIVTIDHL